MDKKEILATYHKLLLEALRAREREIFPYLVILGPAIGGFMWLLYHMEGTDSNIIIITTAGIWLLLLLGAWYSAALGYNYRYILLQLKRLEKDLDIQESMLTSWTKTWEQIKNNFQIVCCIPWCEPPEVIKWFWYAFLVLILFITITTYLYTNKCMILILGIASLLLGILSAVYYGCKIHKICVLEIKKDSIHN